MGAVEQSCATVEACLSELDETYDSFSITQTTISVSASRYERECEKARAGYVELYAKVENDDSEVLYVEDDDELALPSTSTNDREFETAVTTAVTDTTDIDCHVVGVEEVTIIGVNNADSAESGTVYRLAILFEARPTGEGSTSKAVWEHSATRETPAYM